MQKIFLTTVPSFIHICWFLYKCDAVWVVIIQDRNQVRKCQIKHKLCRAAKTTTPAAPFLTEVDFNYSNQLTTGAFRATNT